LARMNREIGETEAKEGATKINLQKMERESSY
jgi:hypothetical protein